MEGGDGSDTYFVDNLGDIVTETNADSVTGGDDLVNSSVGFVLGDNLERLILTGRLAISGTGNALANTITGNGGANIIEGGAANDVLTGGAGIDTLSYASSALGVDVTLRDGILAALASGGDADGDVATGFENLIGSNQADKLTGNGLANMIDGRGGADEMAGLLGNDIYVVDDDLDIVTEQVGQGHDKVQSYKTFDLSTRGANVENLDLLGSNNIDGTGNAFANIIIGNSGANTLDGGIDSSAAIVDQLKGGAGNDIYIVRTSTDIVTELINEGTDTVRSFITYTLGLNLENLELQGTAVINGTGNTLANIITGNSAGNVLAGSGGADTLNGGDGGDTLNGGVGNDTLTGGLDADSFLFNSALSTATVKNVDTLTDFETEVDTIKLENAIFTTVGAAGALASGAIAVGSAAVDASDRLIYDPSTGALFYDRDGSGASVQVQFAKLTVGLSLAATDFVIV